MVWFVKFTEFEEDCGCGVRWESVAGEVLLYGMTELVDHSSCFHHITAKEIAMRILIVIFIKRECLDHMILFER